MLGRYFYFETNGSNLNEGNHVVEIQIVDKTGVNRALGRGLLNHNCVGDGNSSIYCNPSLVTDGNTATDPYFYITVGKAYLTIDLGDVYDIAYIKIWRYYEDGRTYRGVFVKVSKDNISYKTVFSSEKDGEYVETSAGKTIDITNVKYDERYLIRSNSMLYSTVNGSLEELSETNVTADIFRTYGSDLLPSSDVLLSVPNPELLCWKQEGDLPKITAKLTATPHTQSIITNAIDLTHHTITGIEKATLNCEGNVVFAVSFDNKATWKSWNGTEWSTVSEEFSGMTKELFEAITYDQWLLLFEESSSFYIRASLLDATAKLTQIYIDFAN